MCSLNSIYYGLSLICVLVARPRRCPTLSNPVPWQNWMVAYLGYTLRMKTLFRRWPVMVHDAHTRRRRLNCVCVLYWFVCWQYFYARDFWYEQDAVFWLQFGVSDTEGGVCLWQVGLGLGSLGMNKPYLVWWQLNVHMHDIIIRAVND